MALGSQPTGKGDSVQLQANNSNEKTNGFFPLETPEGDEALPTPWYELSEAHIRLQISIDLI